MFLGGLKEKAARRAIEKSIQQRVRQADLPQAFDLKNTLCIGLLLQEDDAVYESISQALRQCFGQEDSHIDTVTYVSSWSKEKMSQENLIHESLLGWRGVIKSSGLQTFVNTPFDVLLCYYPDANTPLDLLASKSKARLIVGIQEDALGLFDLVIHTKLSEVNVFVKELYRYLSILKIA